MFLAKDKNLHPLHILCRFNSITHLYYLITELKFILPSISNIWLFWSVNHTSIALNSELHAFKKIKFVGEISSNWPNGSFGTNVYKTLESC